LRVVITNAVISNTGDAAILAGIVGALREVTTVTGLVVFDSNAETTRDLYPEWNVRQQLTMPVLRHVTLVSRAKRKALLVFLDGLARVPALAKLAARSHRIVKTPVTRALHTIAGADVVVATGGTYLVDHYDFSAKVLELRLAAALGRPIVLWTQSMGPFASERARRQITELGRVDAVFFRDQRSQTNWDTINTPATIEAVVADAAFTLPPAAVPEPEPAGGGHHAILCVRDWAHKGADGGAVDRAGYIQAVRALADGLLTAGWRVTALSTCQGLPSYPTDDSIFATEAFAGLAVHIDRVHRSPSELQSQLASADLVVTARMHLAILGLIQQTPTVAIAYEFKSLELFKSVGLGEQVVRLEDISVDWADALVASLPSGVPVLEPDILAELARSSREPAAAVLRVANR
jgi:colanic acid/amylovoran biosynthesis protein